MSTIIGQVLASTSIDRYWDQLSEEDLTKLYNQLPDPFIFNQEHNLGSKPAGIGRNKRLERLDSGELALKMDVEIYDDAVGIDFKGFSITYSTCTYKNDLRLPSDIKVRFNPKQVEKGKFIELLKLSTDSVNFEIVEIKQKNLEQPLIIVVIEFIGISIAAGFLGKMGSDVYDKLKQKLIEIGNDTNQKTRNKIIYQFIFKFDINSEPVEILVNCVYDTLDSIKENGIDLESINEYLKDKIGDSKLLRVIIEPIPEEPFWKIIHIIDSDGKCIDL